MKMRRMITLAAIGAVLSAGSLSLAIPAQAAPSRATGHATYWTDSPGWKMVSVTTSPDGVQSATTCSETMCLYVNGDALHVNYAVVTNESGKTQRPFISSTYDRRTHTGPTRTNGASWRYDYNVTMNNGNKVCGSMEGLGVGCLNITP